MRSGADRTRAASAAQRNARSLSGDPSTPTMTGEVPIHASTHEPVEDRVRLVMSRCAWLSIGTYEYTRVRPLTPPYDPSCPGAAGAHRDEGPAAGTE
ncbi:hypothetical protein GCM10009864_57240 [Streptomyces lunalinharesii]|uniref:Uncharacterized protein n=1 Tax=Streptomyces lunalinharesii TaxID=333384 RepID=A0ABN3SIA7_9ACTN